MKGKPVKIDPGKLSRFLCLILTVFVFGLINKATVNAQGISQRELSRKMVLHHVAHAKPTLFVHFDKTVYTNNEDVWFTAYLLKSTVQTLATHTVLAVALVRDVDTVIIKQEKYVIENGIAFGNMELPDSLMAGNYHFMVTTNRVNKGKPEALFIQPIIIKTNIELSYRANINILSAGIPGKQPTQLSVRVNTVDGRLLPKPAEVSYRYGNFSGKSKTGSLGEALFAVDDQPGLADQHVYVNVKYGKEINTMNVPLAHSIKKAKVAFYPEGGDLVTGINSRIAWEVKDPQGNVVAVQAVLSKNQMPIDTIETNGFGIGSFFLKPEPGSVYSLQLAHNGFADSTYLLPVPKNQGVSLSVAEGAVTGKLMVNLAGSHPQKVLVRLHDFVNTYYYSDFEISSKVQTFEIPLQEISKGLKAVTVFDTLGRPLAERMVFANYSPVNKIEITTAKQSYKQREKVALHIKLAGLDTVGLVSIACIQESRNSVLLTTDIESYVYLNSELKDLPAAAAGEAYQNKNYVEDVLLTKGWRRYTWTDIVKTTEADTVKSYQAMNTEAAVLKADKPLKKSITMIVIQDSSSNIYQTSSSGHLNVSNADLVVPYGKKVRLAAVGRGSDEIKIVIKDPWEQLNRLYVRRFSREMNFVPSTVQNNSELSLKNNEKVIRLKEVNITSVNGGELAYQKGRNSCGDYVCVMNVLNCPNHPPYKQPVPGQMYNIIGFGMKMYEKCRESEIMRIVPGIYTHKEFYVNTYEQPSEPALVSTLYWNHGTMLNKQNPEINFYTGDITGKFKIVVQGITDTDLIYGQHSFEVEAGVK
jgi:hypothetical protein